MLVGIVDLSQVFEHQKTVGKTQIEKRTDFIVHVLPTDFECCKAQGMQKAEAYLEATAHVYNDHDRGNTDNPDRVSQGVKNLVPSTRSKGMVASVGHAKVAVCHKHVSHCHTKLQAIKHLIEEDSLAEKVTERGAIGQEGLLTHCIILCESSMRVP